MHRTLHVPPFVPYPDDGCLPLHHSYLLEGGRLQPVKTLQRLESELRPGAEHAGQAGGAPASHVPAPGQEINTTAGQCVNDSFLVNRLFPNPAE